MHQTRPVTVKTLIAYGVGDIFGGGAFLIISILFMFFLTDVVGLSPSMAGTLVLVGKIWDAVIDPFIGYVTDHTHTRYGRRRIYFLLGIIPIAVSFTLLWVPFQHGSMLAKFGYYLFAYMFFCTVFSFIMIPYAALNAELSDDYQVRTRLSGARLLFSQISSLLAAVIPNIIVTRVGDPVLGHIVMGVTFGIFFALPWLLVFFGTWELPPAEPEKGAVVITDFITNFLTLFRNRSFQIHMGMYLLAYSAMDLMMVAFKYFLNYYLGKPGLLSPCLGSLMVAQIVMLPVYVFIANKRGKGFAYIVGLAIWGLAMLLTMFLTPGTSVVLIVGLCILMGVGLSSGTMIPWAILPEVTDVDEMITATQRAGAYAGAMALIRQMVQAVVLFGFGISLDLIGYVPNVAQSPATLFKLRMLFFLAPFIFIIGGILVASRFRITPQTHAVLSDEIKRLKAGGCKDEADAQTRLVCAQLTGIAYEKLYRKEEI